MRCLVVEHASCTERKSSDARCSTADQPRLKLCKNYAALLLSPVCFTGLHSDSGMCSHVTFVNVGCLVVLHDQPAIQQAGTHCCGLI